MIGQKPTVGRSVYYQAYGTPGGEHPSVPRAATITEVVEAPAGTPIADAPHGVLVSLCVMNPTGLFFNLRVPYSETAKPGHWNWPPRV